MCGELQGQAGARRHMAPPPTIHAAVRMPEPDALPPAGRWSTTSWRALLAPEVVRSPERRREQPATVAGDDRGRRRGGLLGRFQVHGQRMALAAGDRHDLALVGIAGRANDDLGVARGKLDGHGSGSVPTDGR